MRSESEIRWVRGRVWEAADNLDGRRELVTEWHAIVPGVGDPDTYPGTACGTVVHGRLQFRPTTGQGRDDKLHPPCLRAVRKWLKSAGSSPGSWNPDEPAPEYAPPRRPYEAP